MRRGNKMCLLHDSYELSNYYVVAIGQEAFYVDLRIVTADWLFYDVFTETVQFRFTDQYLRNRKHVPCSYRVIQTRVEVWENEKCCGNTSRRRVFPQLFRVLPNFHELSNSIETRSTFLLFLLENNATRKRKTTC